MSDLRGGLLARDAPIDTIDLSRLKARTGIAKPAEPTSIWTQFRTTAENAAGYTELQELEREKAIRDSYAPLVAELRGMGLDDDRYETRLLPGMPAFYNRTAIFEGIARARARDPDAFAKVPKSADELERAATAPIEQRYAERNRIEANSRTLPWLAGQFAGGMSEPINAATMMVGGGAQRTLAAAILRDAKINLAIEAPLSATRVVDRGVRGKETAAGEVASDLALAAGTGGAFGALAHGAGRAVETRWGAQAREARERIGTDRMTDAERAAAAVLERADAIAQDSPFVPGAGTEAHLDRMDAAAAALDGNTSALDRLIPITPVRHARPISTGDAAARLQDDPWQSVVKPRIARRESGGDDAARNPRSSATGRYQVIDGTWLRYARQFPDAANKTDAHLLSLRTHPVWQERVMDRLGADYYRTLGELDVPATAGNLYLLHFAGEGGGSKILRAAPDTPIEQLLSAAAIKANPFLRGKTASDVIDWAHGAMKDKRHDGPVLRRDNFDEGEAGDAEWAASQREIDAAEADLRAAEAEAARADYPPGGDDVPFDLDDPRGLASERPGRDPFDDIDGAALDAGRAGEGFEPPAPRIVPDGQRVTMPVRQARTLGEARAAAKEFLGREIVNEAEGTIATVSSRTLGKMTSQSAHVKSISPALHAEAVANADVLFRNATLIERGPDARGEPSIAAISRWESYLDATTGVHPVKLTVKETIDPTTSNPLYTVEVREVGAALRAPPEGRIERDGGTRPLSGQSAPDGNIGTDPARGNLDTGDGGSTMDAEGFDGPDDIAAERQIDSLEHDLRMFLEEEEAKGLTVRLDEEGDVISAADAMHALDDDEAAIDAARACMVPRGGPDT